MRREPRRWTVPAWTSIQGLTHAFFGREGGVSAGVFASLNCSERVGDDPAAAQENRQRALRALCAPRLVVPRQVHGDAIAVAAVTSEVRDADGVILGEPGAVAGVLTADCVPLLFIVPAARLAAAVHAGWKGTALGIAAGAVERLCAVSGLDADAIEVALGPAIGGCCYQVGEEVVAAIGSGRARGRVRIHRREGDRAWIDLREINAGELCAAGVPAGNIHRIGPCTRCAQSEFFSHRASGGTTGRQLSAIGWL